jgi:PIN domain
LRDELVDGSGGARRSRGMFRSQGELFTPDVSAAVSADPADTKFLECTGATQADYIVTGNKRDFPDVSYGVTRVVSANDVGVAVQWRRVSRSHRVHDGDRA